MLELKNKRVLALSPHTDDIELGSGATVNMMLQNNCEVTYVAFSICEESVPEGYAKDTLEKECRASTQQLGIPDSHLVIKKYPVRRFNEHRQNILEDIVSLRSQVDPDLIFCPSSFSIHQDHQVIYNEALRAFKMRTILGYELPWDTRSFTTSAIIKVDEDNVRAKVNALQEYKTQGFRNYCSEEYTKAHLSARGIQVGAKYAEAFEVIRIVT